MPYFGFKGGIHPKYNKSATEAKSVETLPVEVGEVVHIPLAQHIGAPAKVLVKKNQQVKTGEPIGEAAGFISTTIHSSVTGKVVAVGTVPHPVGGRVPGVSIEVEEVGDGYMPLEDAATFQRAVMFGGIAGMGGATFPSHVKLSPPKDVDALLINGAECEPYLTCDHRIMLERTEDIIKGASIIREKLNLERLVVGIEKNKPDAIAAFKKYEKEYNFELVELEVKYPQGGEKQLIKACLDRVVPEGQLPMEVGVIVHNVGTCAAIYDVVEHKKPLYERMVTVTGAVKEPKNLMVRVGTPVSKLIEYCGGFTGKPKKIVMGGPMMGLAITTIDTPVMKGTSGILVYREEDMPDLKQYKCMRCGRCIEACPMGLIPSAMDRFVIKELYESLADWHVMNCIECGCCSYVCPSRRTLASGFKTSKRIVAGILRAREENKNG
ncbi:MAG: electron transport complex subunit RsxC [Deferribacterales bacterium]|jgi:electron transport complex protein RnfC